MLSLKDIFTYNTPLNFSVALFWYLFAAVLFVLQLIQFLKGKKTKIIVRNMFLLVFSLFFYYKSSGWYFFLLLFSTVVDYFIGAAIYQSQDRLVKKLLVALSVTVNLGMLAYYKYTFFITGLINETLGTNFEAYDLFADLSNMIIGTSFDVSGIFLPVGISFYTFQTISYSIDLYRKHVTPVNNILDFAFYVSFFPQLVAGPIVRASEFIPQIYEEYQLNKVSYNRALFLILIGLIKKILISDYISVNIVDRVFEDPLRYSGFENLMGVYGYTIQIYCDFSAYSDIAIGVALLLGFRLPENFRSPYIAANITDFWRRWHISLSSWLRDYLYIPLGGNRKGVIRTYLNLFLTMLLGGLWHGAHLKFIIWGGLHGTALAYHKWWQALKNQNYVKRAWSVFGIFTSYYAILGTIILIHFGTLSLSKEQRHSEFFDTIVIFDLGIKIVLAIMLLAWFIDMLLKLTLKNNQPFLYNWASKLFTFHFVIFCWLFFRAGNVSIVTHVIHQIYYNFKGGAITKMVPAFPFLAGSFLSITAIFIVFRMLNKRFKVKLRRTLSSTEGTKAFRTFLLTAIPFAVLVFLGKRYEIFDGYNLICFLLMLGFGIHWIGKPVKSAWLQFFAALPDPIKALLIATVILVLYQFKVAGAQPFIYFQF